MLTKINEKKCDLSEQKELLDVLVRTLEIERQLMDPLVQEKCSNLLLDILNDVRETKCEKIDENCRLGLGEYAY